MATADAVFTALADRTRREVLTLVAERGPASATTLGQALPVSRQAVVKHLAVLRSAGLVAARRQGQEVQYALVPDAFAEASQWIAHLGARWDARLARLTAFLASEPNPPNPAMLSSEPNPSNPAMLSSEPNLSNPAMQSSEPNSPSPVVLASIPNPPNPSPP